MEKRNGSTDYRNFFVDELIEQMQAIYEEYGPVCQWRINDKSEILNSTYDKDAGESVDVAYFSKGLPSL